VAALVLGLAACAGGESPTAPNGAPLAAAAAPNEVVYTSACLDPAILEPSLDGRSLGLYLFPPGAMLAESTTVGPHRVGYTWWTQGGGVEVRDTLTVHGSTAYRMECAA
jgi:hypothetical protein